MIEFTGSSRFIKETCGTITDIDFILKSRLAMDSYYLRNGDIEHGPFTLDELRKTDLSDFVEFKNNEENLWKPIETLEGLFVQESEGQTKSWETELMIDGVKHQLSVNPDQSSLNKTVPQKFEIRIDNAFYGNITCNIEGWKMDVEHPQKIISEIGNVITEYYE